MHENTEFTLSRDTDAIQIPSGNKTTIPAGTQGVITQTLGGSYTIATYQGLARIAEKDLDALGIEKPHEAANPAANGANGSGGEVDEKAVWEQLRQCYDPEIPVNIVDLGLVYDCQLNKSENGGTKVDVKMTLTAPGCGMGPAIAVASVATELLAGKTVAEAKSMSGEELAAPLGALPPVRIHCAQLVEGALRNALADKSEPAPQQPPASTSPTLMDQLSAGTGAKKVKIVMNS